MLSGRGNGLGTLYFRGFELDLEKGCWFWLKTLTWRLTLLVPVPCTVPGPFFAAEYFGWNPQSFSVLHAHWKELVEGERVVAVPQSALYLVFRSLHFDR